MSTPGTIKAAAALVAAILATAIPAAATEATRTTYTAAAEPICQANTQANERILSGVRQQVKAGKLGPAATKFAKAAKALKATQAQLAALPQPSADVPKLTKWLTYLKTEAAYFATAATELRSGDKTAAAATVIRLTHTANLANNQVSAFEFEYCRLEPARFT